jgi:hypothetical protein
MTLYQSTVEFLLDVAYWLFVPILLAVYLAYRVADRVCRAMEVDHDSRQP